MVFHADMCMFLPAAIVNIFARRWKNTTTFFLANNTLRWLSFIKNVYNTSKMHNFFFSSSSATRYLSYDQKWKYRIKNVIKKQKKKQK